MQVNTNRIPNEYSNIGAPWRIWQLAEHSDMTGEAAAMGHERLYLVTDLVGFYEKCGWEYRGDAHESDGSAIRLYGTDTLS